MLIEFEVKNFQSIRDAAALSMVAGRGDELVDANTFASGIASFSRLLRSTAVYGPNGSGKTCLVRALRTMQEIIRHSAKDQQQDEALPVVPFLLDVRSRSRPSEFEATFIQDGVRYQYGFAATSERVTEEWLLAFPRGRPQRWIERKYNPATDSDDWGAMGKLEGAESARSFWRLATRGNALFLSTAVQLNNEQLRPVYEWFSKTLKVIGPGGRLPSHHSQLFCERPETKRVVLTFLKTAGIDVDDIVVEREEAREESNPPASPENGRRLRTLGRPKVHFRYRVADKAVQPLEWTDESDGTRQLFAYAAPVMQALRDGLVLVVDELHNHLHSQLVKFLVELFHSPETDFSKAQLVFTTHDTSILNKQLFERLFRRDQIWFCERKKRVTQLFRLTDFSPRKEEENFERRYQSGRYGALPYVRSMGELHDVLEDGW